MKDRLSLNIKSIILFIIFVLMVSCVPSKKLKYFNDINELQEPAINPREQKLIAPFDKLYIKVLSIDDKTNQLFNSGNNMSSNITSLIGNYVDESGNINFPFAGKIKVGGFTTSEAGKKLEEALNSYVSNAVVDVRFIDNNVTIMGEVQNQGTFPFLQDKLTIYEALALGGGISRFGDRKNVILIRQEGDKILHSKLNLSDSKISGKDNYYIQANDIIVVEPLRSSSWYNFNSATYNTILTSFTTLLAIFVVFFQK
jgi:polysaccharide biosynthesis/export protein